jgi:hypothetical protein
VRITQSFTIQARDKFGRNRSAGADAFSVAIFHASTHSATDVTFKQKDLGNGEHQVVWRTTQSGKHVIKVQLHGKDIQGSPMEIMVHPTTVQVQGAFTLRCLESFIMA